MNYEASEAAAFRQRLLTQPGERRGAEYKAAVRFAATDAFSLKLLRQIQGIANGGGGWLVIGFKAEPSGLLQPDPAHSDAIAATYEPTELAKQANATVHRGQQLRFSVFQEPHPETGLKHPVISIDGFDRTPFVSRSAMAASDSGDRILEQGVVYLRREGAETSKVTTPEDWEDLISRAVANRRSDTLAELRALLDGMVEPAATPSSAVKSFEDWTAVSHNRAFKMDGG